MVFEFIMLKWVDEAIEGDIDDTQFGRISQHAGRSIIVICSLCHGLIPCDPHV